MIARGRLMRVGQGGCKWGANTAQNSTKRAPMRGNAWRKRTMTLHLKGGSSYGGSSYTA